MSLRKLLLLIAALLSLNFLVEAASTNVKPLTLRNTTDLHLDFINQLANTSNIIRLRNGTSYKFMMNSRLRTKRNVSPQKKKKNPPSGKELIVRVCPKQLVPLKNITKEKLLGTWYAYGTTPLKTRQYIRSCASYNVIRNPYFYTNIIATDYKQYCITYSCLPNPITKLYDIKLRILTRTRIPMTSTLHEIDNFLLNLKFPTAELIYLGTEAFCFEWYQLKFELYPRPGRFQAPWNPYLDH